MSTSFTTAVMTVMLLIFGVASIREFALPLTVGILCGTYSSICIATELWFMMHLRDKAPVSKKSSKKSSK
jgi:SecD/SecF fusion protein